MENIEQVNTEAPDEGGIQQLREEYKKLKAENKAYKQNVMNSALQSLGLEADKGIGKAVTKMYDGEMNGEAIAAFVQEEFGEVGAIDAKTEPDTADNVVQAQSRVEQLNKIGVSSEPTDVMDAFKDVVSSGNVSDSIKARMAMMENKKQ